MGFYLFALWDCLGLTKKGIGYTLGLVGCSDWASTSVGVAVGAIMFDVACLVRAE